MDISNDKSFSDYHKYPSDIWTKKAINKTKDIMAIIAVKFIPELKTSFVKLYFVDISVAPAQSKILNIKNCKQNFVEITKTHCQRNMHELKFHDNGTFVYKRYQEFNLKTQKWHLMFSEPKDAEHELINIKLYEIKFKHNKSKNRMEVINEWISEEYDEAFK